MYEPRTATSRPPAGIKYALEGQLQGDGERIRLSFHLTDEAGAVSWSDNFNRTVGDTLAVQSEVADKAVGAMRLGEPGPDKPGQMVARYLDLPSVMRRLMPMQAATGPTASKSAWDLYMRGRNLWDDRTLDSTLAAIEYFQRALKEDEKFGLAYAAIADAQTTLMEHQYAPQNELLEAARRNAEKAITVSPNLEEGYVSLAAVKQQLWDWAGAEREFKRAIEINPSNANAHQGYAFYFVVRGQFDRALAEIQRSRELDPLSLIIRANIGTIEYFARRYDAAIARERKVLEADPNFVQARRKLGFALEAKGMEQEAVTEWLTVERQMGTDDETLEGYKKASASAGIRGYWRYALEIEKKDVGNEAGALSSYYARLGDREQAFFWLDRAYDQRAPWLVYSKVTPVYDNLRSDSRFTAFLQRMGL